MRLSVPARSAVSIAEQIDQQPRLGIVASDCCETYFTRLVVEVVHEQRGIVAPVIAQYEHSAVGRVDHLEVAPADFRHLLAHANDPLGPIEHRSRLAPLCRGIDVPIAVRAGIDDGHHRLLALSETCMWLGRPLHGGTSTTPIWEI